MQVDNQIINEKRKCRKDEKIDAETMGGYTVISVVGKGAFGTAYRARDPTGEECVIKQIDVTRMNDRQRNDCLKEVETLSKAASHPFIVRYRDAFLSQKHLCIVMDFCSGGELWTSIRKRAISNMPFSEAQLRLWLMQMVVGLHYLHHDLKTLHRDLKTSNMFIDKNGRTRIGDFGLARVLMATVAQAQTFCGTPSYMAPEVMKEHPYSWPADIWSLGVIMFELAALDMPFKGNNMIILAQRICTAPTPMLPNRYSSEFCDIIYRMLEKEPAKRPSAQELLVKPLIQNELIAYRKKLSIR